MKSTVKSSNLFKTIAISATAAVLIAASPLKSSANNAKANHENVNKIPANQIDVQFIGTVENNFKFKVEFENTSAQPFTLTIKNDEGQVVYSKEFSDVHFSKTVTLVNDGEMVSIHPTFLVTVGTRLVQRSFSIEPKTVQNVVVSNK